LRQAVFTELAEGDLAEIWVEIARSDIDVADRFVDEVRAKAIQLAEFPLMGVARPELGLDVRSLPHGDYLVIYRPMASGVGIARVAHGRRDLRKLIVPRE
jgi:plasmid stabilization system protein ParE